MVKPQIPSSLPLVVLISGEGSNLQAILDRAASGALPVEVRAVVSDRGAARGLARARAAGVPAQVLSAEKYPQRDGYDAALADLLERYAPGLIVLAGFMRILGPAFVRRYRGRLLNIHPSLLPKYRGLHTHRRVLQSGDREHGCSVHFVTEELDGGPVIAQAKVPVHPGDTEETLRARVQKQEHRLYPLVIGWFAAGRLALAGEEVQLDGRALARPELLQ